MACGLQLGQETHEDGGGGGGLGVREKQPVEGPN